MDSETKRIKNEKDLVTQNKNISQGVPINQPNNVPQQPLVYYQNIQVPQQPGVQQYPQQPYIINQPIIYQQPYNQQMIIYPNQLNNLIIPNQQNLIVNNQVSPIAKPIKWTMNPRLIICPFCQKNIKTRVEEEFNSLTCCIWLSCIILFPLALYAVGSSGASCGGDCCSKKKEEQKKDENEVIEKNDKSCICCYDGIHYCPECGKVLGVYKSC